MSLYIDKKKVNRVYHNGLAITGIYRNGVRLWGNESTSIIKGIKLEAVADIDRIYLNYALAEIQAGQVDNWVDVEVGSKTFRLAGDMTSRNKASFAADTLTWGNVKVTSDDVWVGSTVTMRVKVGQMSRKATNNAWETKQKGLVSFGSTALAPETSFRINLYNPLVKIVNQSRGIKGKLTVRMLVGNDEVDSYTQSISLGSKGTYAKDWVVSEEIHSLFTEHRPVSFELSLDDVSYFGPNTSGLSLQVLATNTETSGVFMETAAIERTIQLKVKEVVK